MRQNQKNTQLPLRKKIIFALIIVFCIFSGLEITLRTFGFRYATVPLSMEYVNWIAALGHDHPSKDRNLKIAYKVDPVYLWRPAVNPNVTNSMGLRGPEWSSEKRQGTLRIIALGDSCTAVGEPPYPKRLEKELNSAATGRHYEVLNSGVGSWSSYQGMIFLKNELLGFKPDFVTIYFGWNDHWLAWSHPDRDMAAYLAPKAKLINALNRSRIAQLLTYLTVKLKPRGNKTDTEKPVFRVAAEDYYSNLTYMVKSVRVAGGTPILITAPTSLTPDDESVRYLCYGSKLFHKPGEINKVHALYNSIVRKVAEDNRVPLLDLEKLILQKKEPEKLFTDGIHLTEEGLSWVAKELGSIIKKHTP